MTRATRRTARTGTVAGVAALAALLASGAAFAGTLAPDTSTIVTVTSADSTTDEDLGDTNGWIQQSYDCSDENGSWITPTQSFRNGPAKPVLGAGSHEMQTGPLEADTQLFRTGQYDGTYASDIVHLAYSTFTNPASDSTGDRQPVYLRLSFDTDGQPGTDLSLFYEPSVSHPDSIENGVWQSWIPTNDGEKWVIGGDASNPDNVITWQDFQDQYGDATLTNTENGGGVAFIAGCGGSGQTDGVFDVDGFGIETTAAHEGATADAVAQYVDFEGSGNGLDDNGTETVTTDGEHGWNQAAYDYDSDTVPAQRMVVGPDGQPYGNGSHKFRVTDQTVTELYRTTDLDGTLVGDIRDLDYWSYQQPDAGSGDQQPPYLRLSIDTDGDGFGDDVLYYEPAINGHTVLQDTWQHWTNAADELWSRSGQGDSDSDLTTLAGYASHHPQATLAESEDAAGHGGLSIIVGCSCSQQDDANFYVDGVHVRYFDDSGQETAQTYDFEPTIPRPTISAPSRVTGRTSVTIHGTAVPNSTVTLYEKRWGKGFAAAGTTETDGSGRYTFHRTITTQTSWYVNNLGKNSTVVTTKVRVKVYLTTSSPHTGRLRMHVNTEPNTPDEVVRYYRLFGSGETKLLAKRTTNQWGNSTVTVDAPSGHRVTVFATVQPGPGNLAGRSPNQHQTIQ